MWKFIKGLFGKKKVQEEKMVVREVEAKVAYEYPKTGLVPVNLPPRKVEAKKMPQVSVREWLSYCREVDAVLGSLG